ncbi:MAG: TerB family tellurite resistance protein [Candidatus Hydrogenedentes bacterium]|nr:TerB family tellurite resistance protein [Candidatus Hydrogenedentota bacterium]
MLERLFDLFAVKPAEGARETNDERVRLAVCVLLLEVAGADNEFSPVECERIVGTLRDRFGLAQEEAESLIRDAQERRDGSSDVWKFTNQINQGCSVGEKVRTIEEIWRVIYSDGTLDGHEDYLVHKLARLLNLTHPQLITAKMKVLGELRG